jgi:uncharacterized protein YjbI with pentapeptide repeats
LRCQQIAADQAATAPHESRHYAARRSCVAPPAEGVLLIPHKHSEFHTTLSSWRSGTDCCRWEGVRCDGITGRVTAVDLSSSCLKVCGGLHPALFNLTSLRYLNLEGLDLCGSQLPESGLERLTNLRVLMLESCNLSGSIPPSFTSLHSLQEIHLSHNTLNGNISNLFAAHSFPHLRVLDLSSNMFEGTFPLGITQLKKSQGSRS